MLRNDHDADDAERRDFLLNEVLSLNAQEFSALSKRWQATGVLNEVLSLNAQE